jgi:hypothetical protein
MLHQDIDFLIIFHAILNNTSVTKYFIFYERAFGFSKKFITSDICFKYILNIK